VHLSTLDGIQVPWSAVHAGQSGRSGAGVGRGVVAAAAPVSAPAGPTAP